MIDTLVGAGANEIGGINFMVSQASKLLDDAREQAIADARRKAEIYAKAAGVTLGAPLSISEEGCPQPDAVPQDGGRHGRLRAGGAGRRDAVGDGERVLGDQAEGVATFASNTLRLILRSALLARVSKDGDTPSCFETALRTRLLSMRATSVRALRR